MKRSIGRIIAKLIFWGLEVLAAYFWFEVVSIYDFRNELLEGILVSAFAAYFIAIIVCLLVWIFNFAHKFDDYDSISNGLASCVAFAPFNLAINLVTHLINIILYLIFGEKRNHNTFSKQETDADADEDNRTDAILINHLKSRAWSIANEGIYYPSYSEHRGRWVNGPDVQILFGNKLLVRGTIGIEFTGVDGTLESEKHNPSVLKEIRDNTASNIRDKIFAEIPKLRERYKNYDREYTIEVSVSARWL